MSRDSEVDRRRFLGVTAAAAAAMFIKPALVHGTHANSAIRIGLLGCGGRGTEDAGNLLDTGGARVVALADLFQDQLDAAHAHFDQIQQAKGNAALNLIEVCRSEEHTSELQSRPHIVCRLLLEK